MIVGSVGVVWIHRSSQSAKSRRCCTPGTKTAVSIPDDVFDDADRLARRLGHSKSQLYSRALREFVARHEQSAVSAAVDAVVAEDPTIDWFVDRAGRRAVARSDW